MLSNAVFRNCYVTEASVSFANADAAGVTLEGCRLERSIFRSARLLGATIRGTSLEHADLYNCCLDNAHLVEMNLARANLHLASLRNVRIVDVKFRPALRTRAGGIFKLLWQDEIETRTIFTAGTELSPFVAHCAREYRLSQLAADLVSRRRLWRAPNVLFVSLFGVVSDFGSSLWRWSGVTSAVVGGFAAYFALLEQTRTVGDALAMSVLNFVGASTHVPGAPTSAIVVEHVAGYFMLGLLISVLTFKFVERW